MEAMILAAGLGTRLRPLTDHVPKALVPVDGVPMLEHVARRLIEADADHLIINLHHHADQIRSYVERRDHFGVEVSFSLEPERALDTGGGLKHAASLFRGTTDFLLHNVDVLSDIDLRAFYRSHRESGALATLAVRDSEHARYLLVTDDGRFCGYGSRSAGDRYCSRFERREQVRRVDFCGVHALHPRLLELLSEDGAFSIIYTYFRLADEGHAIRAIDVSDVWWMDIGTHESLEAARLHLQSAPERQDRSS